MAPIYAPAPITTSRRMYTFAEAATISGVHFNHLHQRRADGWLAWRGVHPVKLDRWMIPADDFDAYVMDCGSTLAKLQVLLGQVRRQRQTLSALAKRVGALEDRTGAFEPARPALRLVTARRAAILPDSRTGGRYGPTGGRARPR